MPEGIGEGAPQPNSEPVPEVHDSERETPSLRPFTVQTPQEFRNDFVAEIRATPPGGQIGLEVMQFERCDNTQPIFDAIQEVHERGDRDVRFHYDRIARDHIRVKSDDGGHDQAWAALGRTLYHRGNRQALREAYADREALLQQLIEQGITNEGEKHRFLSHNHVKIALANEAAWFGTMNMRELDFDMSNFMIKLTDPRWVGVIQDVFEQTEKPHDKSEKKADKVYADNDEGLPSTTEFLLDAGERGQSIIYERANQMAASLQEGDEFILIGQWPPIKRMYGHIIETLDEKTMSAGAHGTYLMSPAEKLHPHRRASLFLQKQVEKKHANNPNVALENLARETHLKILLIKHADGSREMIAGSHNLTKSTVRHGTRELSMWTKDATVIDQVEDYVTQIRGESKAV
ncbi:MAG: hypothetical protein H0W89_06685 [Candidatus Levybacteria bacterium]|nr:hypothetical protein [Candidatus Levybacteria bacterium]